MVHTEVVRLAAEAHQTHWRMAGDAGTGDRLAAAVTAAWQTAVLNRFPRRFAREQRIGQLNERIDLVDLVGGVAYELKVSPNNDHFEFYRDIFKVLIARDNGLPQIKAFCFVCPEVTARRYARGLRAAVIAEGARLGLEIAIEGI